MISRILFLVILVVAIVLFVRKIRERIALLKAGTDENRFDRPGERLTVTLINVFLQKRVIEERFSGLMHAFVFWGFVAFSLTTLTEIGRGLISDRFTFFIGFLQPLEIGYIFLVDIFAILVSIGIIALIIRRYVFKPKELSYTTVVGGEIQHHHAESLIVGGLIFGLMVTYLGMVAFQPSEHPLSPIGTTLHAVGGANDLAYHSFWWAHMVLILSFLVYIPYSKHFHLIACPFNEYFRNLESPATITPLDLEDEDAEKFGVTQITDYSWKQLLDLYSCVECGRCRTYCPTYTTEKALDPKKLIIDLRNHLLDQSETILANQKGKNGNGQDSTTEIDLPLIVGETLTPAEIWDCTTCGACMNRCPFYIEHVPKLIGLRQSLMLMESEFPEEAQTALRGIENQGDPWGIGQARRTEWAEGLNVTTMAENADVEYLFWVGCAGAFDARNQKVSQSLVKVLQHAGVSFSILGEEESCTGDSARRMGNEYLFQMQAQMNIETLEGYQVKKIVTACPHCYHTLKNEYPQFGGNYEVVHHTELVADLIQQGKLKPSKALPDTITYHDSCYLGRHNNVYQPQRDILKAIPGSQIIEMERSKANGFCCGAGGARMWMEETEGTRINENRAKEALDTGAKTVASACPFCMTMLTDGIRTHDKTETVQTVDVVELLEKSL
ncbi:MAG: 4Fe-4S dicluster domain-containing protein [Gemmatimonadetes bacterium]|nr:MAG: 4Fe-4S dicluster domain-containing protein [Gemmatimonadota bacterium]